MTAEEFFLEELSGEPLTQRSVINGLVMFAKMRCAEQKQKILEEFNRLGISGSMVREIIKDAYPIYKIK